MIHLLAEAAGKSTDPVSLLITYGPGGLVAVLLATRFLIPKPTYEEAIQAREAALAQAIKDRDTVQAALAQAQAALIARQSESVSRLDYEAQHGELVALRAKLEGDILPSMFKYSSTLERALELVSRLAQRAPIA